MKIKFISILVLCVILLQFYTSNVVAKNSGDIVYAQTTQATCLRSQSKITSTCIMVIPQYKYSTVLTGTINGFIKVKYIVNNHIHYGWILRNKTVLIYN